jgi:prevent-host-death family protein
MAISEFKAKCLAVLEHVRKTGRPIRVTRRGKAVADVVPPAVDIDREAWLESLKGSVTILGDIVGPAADPEEW